MNFEFATSTRILFGPGTLKEVGPAAAAFGKRAFVAVDPVARPRALTELLEKADVEPVLHPVSGEPTVDSLLAAVVAARAGKADLVIGVGGGSALDTGKAVAVLLTNPGEPLDYLEVVGMGRALEKPSAPYIAIPTTAGTGSEVTRNAVLAVPKKHVKVSLRSPFMLPCLAIIDPELTYTVPPAVTAATGLDALTQCLEPYVCNAPNPLVDPLCIEGVRRIARALPWACADGSDKAAREEMALGSLYGGLSLANARLGAVHGLAAAIGGRFPAPHGAVCARLLPLVVETNLRALQARSPESPTLTRYAVIAVNVVNEEFMGFEGLINWLHALIERLRIPTLSTYGIAKKDFPALIAQAQKASSMKGNPIPLTDKELGEILQRAL